MSDKKEKDYRKVDQPKADSLFSNPNTLDELLKDLGDYEEYLPTDNLFNSEKMDRLVREKREPYEDSEKAEKIKKEASGNNFALKETVKNLDDKTLDDILKDSEAYESYLGIANESLPGTKDELVNTEEFPMDTEKTKIAK